MIYTDIEKIQKLINHNTEYQNMFKRLREDSDDWFSSFSDSPERMSKWGHHYFCKKEGGLLHYDRQSPEKHVCSICGEVYNNELLNAVWTTMYRNEGVTTAWKSALVYKISGEQKYLDYVIQFASFYSDHYLEFKLHNKAELEFDRLEDAEWGCARIMPQSLNEAIFLIRLINGLEIVREDLPEGFIQKLSSCLFREAFKVLKPQTGRIHNIPTWLNSCIGVMGLFSDDQEMIEFAIEGDFGVRNQLRKGVTKDFFWYEGSIHYNFFLLEGLSNLLLFARLNDYNFEEGAQIVENMLVAAYNYAFDNHRFPNPNDGWPDINLKTYSYVYAIAAKILGEDSPVFKLLGGILNKEGERGTIPMSRPYFFENRISLEEFLFVPELREAQKSIPSFGSSFFETSYCALLKAHESNLFIKYGHNGPSHAHPDKMNIEVHLKGSLLSRDLSNSGYGNPFCNEWHRVSAAHNTVVVNGENHSGFDGGRCLEKEDGRVKVKASAVYEGVDFIRDVSLTGEGMNDCFDVQSKEEAVFDYFFHVDGSLQEEPDSEAADLGFKNNGYQHLKNIRRVKCSEDTLDLYWLADGNVFRSSINLDGTELYLADSPDNPIVKYRRAIILRQKGRCAFFQIAWVVS